MREVEKKGAVPVIVDETNGLIGIELGQFVRFGRTLYYGFVSVQGDPALILEIDHLYGIQIMVKAEVVVKALTSRQERFAKTRGATFRCRRWRIHCP